jgi:predicted AAA+ superfamily ATPase
MYTRLVSPPKGSFFLLGMRGTGKSSWAKGAYPQAKRIDLLDEAAYQRFLASPDLFASELRHAKAGSWVVVDEVQRLPQLLNEIHRSIEDRRLKFALLGSSARKLRRAGVNLLGGRALLKTMYPLLPAELGDDFSLEAVLRFGSLPLVIASESPEERLEAYVRLYLKEEIQAEALVRSLPGFARFLPIAALFHAQTINVAAIARDAGVARTTAEGYLQVLEDTLLCYRLPAFEPKLRVKERAHPKWYWIDCGVVRAAKGNLAVPGAEERGALFEGFIAMILRAGKDLKFCDYTTLSYWSPPGGETEVDFIIERGKERLAIEVKTAREPNSTHLKGLRAIADLKGLKRRILVYPGTHDRTTEDGIEILGLRTLLKEVFNGL